jgi:hypothetical protein
MKTPPNENIIGRRVVYTPFKGCPTNQLEYGTITSFKKSETGAYDWLIFVRYGTHSHSQGTRPEDLEFEVG